MNWIPILIAYFIGAIPSSVWVGKGFYGIDIREYGSGNAGATNTFRILGKKAGIPVLLFDILKAWFCAAVLSFWFHNNPGTDIKLVLGLAAVIGHIFPIYVGFRGGKGIASLLGVIIAIHLHASLISMCVFVIILMISRFVSLSSILAAITFPTVLMLYFKVTDSSLIVFSLMVTVLVIFTHKKNIERLFNKEESRVNLPRKIFERKSRN